ncbi:hypothetical protein Y039_5717 [Burkholderia pseudomallei MSHR1029]|nr:hypothetical protein X892_5161 [Burkholderia pseudomallei MSHR3960]KGW66484.1 hypothetical protein Y039_5717 [Burkholderia pseudomallei MSHR1029]
MRSIHACRKLYGAKQCLESCRSNGRAAFRAASKFSIVNIATGITEMFTCESTLRSMPMRCSRCKGTRKRGTASCRGLSGQALRQRRRRLRSPPHRRRARRDCRRLPRPGRRVRRSLRRFPRQTVLVRWRLSPRLRHQLHRRCAVRRGAVPFAPTGTSDRNCARPLRGMQCRRQSAAARRPAGEEVQAARRLRHCRTEGGASGHACAVAARRIFPVYWRRPTDVSMPAAKTTA